MKAPKKLVKSAKPKSLEALSKKKKLKIKAAEAAKPQKVKAKVLDDGIAKELKKVPKKSSKQPEKKIKKLGKKSEESSEKSKAKKKKPSKSMQKEIEGLKDIDPEFYQFIKANDKKLLEFNLLDSDDSEDEEDHSAVKEKKKMTKGGKKGGEDSEEEEDNSENDDGNDDDEDEDKFHKPSGELEVASDESDFEDAEDAIDADGTQKVTLNLLRQWQLELEKTNPSIDVIRKVTQAFNSALASISGDGADAGKAPTAFKVVGSSAFNGVIQLCVLHLQPAIVRVLRVTPQSTLPVHRTKKWTKLRGCLRYYLTDLIRLVEQVSSTHILTVLLKHLHQMADMVAAFSQLGKTILKRLIGLWSTGDETVRVLAFLCILKITRKQQVSMLNHVLKAMYLSYVRNSKFVSPNTLPNINFMRRSLVEIFALDLNVSYQHAFLYIRQLAIHLRNAVILKKKDSFQAVYNWQFVNSLRLWSDLLGASTHKPQLQPLIYPLVTIALGVIRLIPTAQYFPLRFHCLQSLISLAKETQTFIPVLPLIVEVLKSNTFNKKHSAVSMRPLSFTCILRLNKAQLSENGFRDEVIEQVCGLTLEYLAHESASLAFCDLVVPTVITLKAYLKECRSPNYSRKLKQLLDKIQDNSRFIEEERKRITFGLSDLAQVQAWEAQVRNKGTPLAIYYSSWVKTHQTKKRRQAALVDTINSDYDLPMIKRSAKSGGVPVKNENGEVELFPSDDEDDDGLGLPVGDDDDDEAKPKAKKQKKDQKKPKEKKRAAEKQVVEDEEQEPEPDEVVDIVKDLDLDDW